MEAGTLERPAGADGQDEQEAAALAAYDAALARGCSEEEARAEAGLPPADGGEPEPDEPEGLWIEAPTGQLGFSVGGKKPDESSLKIVGGKVAVTNTGQVVGCDRRHKGRIVGELQVEGIDGG